MNGLPINPTMRRGRDCVHQDTSSVQIANSLCVRSRAVAAQARPKEALKAHAELVPIMSAMREEGSRFGRLPFSNAAKNVRSPKAKQRREGGKVSCQKI
jgi:hypothetical protein